MKLFNFLTSVILSLAFTISWANASEKIETKVECEKNKYSQDYYLTFSAPKKDTSWYEPSSKLYTLTFTSKSDCDEELDRLTKKDELKEEIFCACSSSAYAPALFLADQYWGFSRLSCVTFDNKFTHQKIIKNKEVVRSNWNEVSENIQEQLKLEKYFDRDDNKGPNYELCKKKIETLYKK